MVALSKEAVKRFSGRYAALGQVEPRGSRQPKSMALLPSRKILEKRVDKPK